MRKTAYPLIFSLALAIEALGVASGSYNYGAFPVKLLGVPLCIAGAWVLIGELAYLVSLKRGSLLGAILPFSIDLVLEPVAYYTGAWTWISPLSRQIYYGSTTANIFVWMAMCYISIQLIKKERCPNCHDTGRVPKVLPSGKVVYMRCFRCPK